MVTPDDELANPTGVTCTSSQFCLIYNQTRLAAFTDPGAASPVWGASYTIARDERAATIVCPSATACIAPSAEGGAALTSLSPATPAAWRSTHVDDGILSDVSCPSTGMCVMLGRGGRAHVSTDPFGAAPGWDTAVIAPSDWSSLACPSPQECLAFSAYGQIATAAAGATPPDHDAPIITITTPMRGQHVALGARIAAVFSCSDGTGTRGRWPSSRARPTAPASSFSGSSCPSIEPGAPAES